VLIIGEAPGQLNTLLGGARGDPERIGYTLFYATNFVLAGLAVALPFRAGLLTSVAKGKLRSAASALRW
jgi:simple sugar transport system permease protein